MDPTAKNAPLIYASDAASGTVDVYNYKRPKKLLGQITGFQLPFGECSDALGHVFVTDYDAADIVEFDHGSTTPVKTLSDSWGSPIGCSVDPTTGNLAISNYSNPGNVSVYVKGSWLHWYITYWQKYWSPGYDNQGNLFVQGLYDDGTPRFDELPAGGTYFSDISLDFTINNPGSVMFDGTYMALTDQEYGGRQSQAGIYRVSISGSTGTAVSSIELTDTCSPSGPFTVMYQPWIYKGNVVSGNLYCPSRFGYWSLADGGSPAKVISPAIAPVRTYGETVSL